MNVPGSWERVQLGEIVKIYSGVAPSLLQLIPSGSHPYVKVEDLNRSAKYIQSSREFTDSVANVTPSGSTVFPKRGAAIMTNKVRFAARDIVLDTNLMALAPGRRIDADFLYYLILGEGLSKLADTSTIPQINNKHVLPHCVSLPPLVEQRKIAEILRTWDHAITKATDLVAGLHTEYLRISNALLTPSGPVLRRLSTTTQSLRQRNGDDLARDKVMGVSNRDGLVPMRAQTIADDISRYHVLPPRAFAYNPMRINVGSIAMSQQVGNVLVSPDYVLFECLTDELLPEYLRHTMKTRRWRHHVNAGGSGSVRTRTYYDDLAAISIHTPPIADQILIAQGLDTAEHEIWLVEDEIALLRTQKRGLMQKLLTGELRVDTGVDEDS